MVNIAFIPARGGSKGIPGKNIKIINGKPLIAWSIEYALSADCIDKVYVSTDSEHIRNVALSYGAHTPYLRPNELSTDSATTESAVLHFIDWANQNDVEMDRIVLIQPTSPLRLPGHLDKAMRQFDKERADSLVTVTKTHRFIWKDPGKPSASYDFFNRPRRQDIQKKDEIYFENGSFYISKVEMYQNHGSRLGGSISTYDMTPEESFEIDDPLDFKLIEFLMQSHNKTNGYK